MSGHTRWWMAKGWPDRAHALGGDVAVANMIQFTQGYILAMEDVLRDIGLASCFSTSTIDYLLGHKHALEDLKHSIEESRDSARRTLEALTKKAEEAQ
jgi:hypothetical protein